MYVVNLPKIKTDPYLKVMKKNVSRNGETQKGDLLLTIRSNEHGLVDKFHEEADKTMG